MDQRERFLNTYANIPLKLRDSVILVLDKKGPITWNVAYLEIRYNTELSKEILNQLNDLKLI